jgi:hypothetical protein
LHFHLRLTPVDGRVKELPVGRPAVPFHLGMISWELGSHDFMVISWWFQWWYSMVMKNMTS